MRCKLTDKSTTPKKNWKLFRNYICVQCKFQYVMIGILNLKKRMKSALETLRNEQKKTPHNINIMY